MSPPVSFLPCTLCARHFRASEPICPFCFARRAGSAVAMAVAMGGAAFSLGACRDASPPNTTVEPSSTSTGEATSPPPVGEPPPSATGTGNDAGMAMSPPRPVYGPPAGFPGDRIPGLRGEIALTPASASAPVPNADKTIAIAKPALRQCYQTGLRKDPAMTGTVKLTMSVDASGAVTNVTSDGGLTPDVQACMRDRMKMLKFDAPGAASTVSTELTCTSTHK